VASLILCHSSHQVLPYARKLKSNSAAQRLVDPGVNGAPDGRVASFGGHDAQDSWRNLGRAAGAVQLMQKGLPHMTEKSILSIDLQLMNIALHMKGTVARAEDLCGI
jgi:hypothetical protein